MLLFHFRAYYNSPRLRSNLNQIIYQIYEGIFMLYVLIKSFKTCLFLKLLLFEFTLLLLYLVKIFSKNSTKFRQCDLNEPFNKVH